MVSEWSGTSWHLEPSSWRPQLPRRKKEEVGGGQGRKGQGRAEPWPGRPALLVVVRFRGLLCVPAFILLCGLSQSVLPLFP